VVDAFGQTVMLPVEPGLVADDAHVKVRRAHNTFIEGLKDGEIELRPRFTTPMRLHFELESSGPVCGWVLPNHMEHSLGIYSATGQALGAFQQRLKRAAGDKAYYWAPFPGDRHEKNGLPRGDALGAFCDWIGGLEVETGDTFSALLDKSIQATDQRVPEEDPGISVLVGRPLALVRARLRLEPAGLPAHSPELAGPVQANALEKAMVTRGFEKVRWPIRVGDQRARNDGLVGAFQCSSSGAPEGPFYATWGEDEDKAGVFGAQDFSLDCEAPLRLVLLMDPQARAHAVMGALPRVHLELPADICLSAKRVRDVFFQTAPLLGESETPAMPLPSDDYGEWSWAWRPGVTTGWKEDPALIEATDRGGFSGRWPSIAEGWLKLRIASVKVVSFWVREGDRVPRNAKIHLAWSVQNAQALDLESSTDGKSFVSVAKWTEQPLPRELEVQAGRAVTYRLTATGDDEGPSNSREIKIEIEGSDNS
jgi:hypothetical protein